VRDRFSENIQAIISLRLLPNKKGTGRVPAVEIMRSTRMLRECLRDPNRTLEIPEHIAKARGLMQMQTFDPHLLDLFRANKISLDAARSAASNPQDLERELALEGGDAPGGDADPVELGESGRF
jgi:twitching motility protein PilT